MQTSLFPSEPPNQSLVISEDKIIQPLTEILENTAPSPSSEQAQSKNNLQSVKQSLDELFPEQQIEEKNIKKTKEILGQIADPFTDEQLKDTMIKIQYLANSWLDDFEKKIFNGLTLQELLHEKGGT